MSVNIVASPDNRIGDFHGDTMKFSRVTQHVPFVYDTPLLEIPSNPNSPRMFRHDMVERLCKILDYNPSQWLALVSGESSMSGDWATTYGEQFHKTARQEVVEVIRL